MAGLSLFKNVLFFVFSQVEQITAEYKARALQCHPDKNEGDKESEQRFQKLQVRRFLIGAFLLISRQ